MFALSLIPDMQEVLLLLRRQAVESTGAARAQVLLAEEVQQLRHELSTVKSELQRRVPEPAPPGAKWVQMAHEGFGGREYWLNVDTQETSWERPVGILPPPPPFLESGGEA